MVKPHEFDVKVTGNPLPGKDTSVFIKRVHARALRLDPNVVYDYTTFAQVRYGMKWYGKITDMGFIDNFYKSVVIYADRYLLNWEFQMIVKYSESEE